jgi:hypothetical protein
MGRYLQQEHGKYFSKGSIFIDDIRAALFAVDAVVLD